MFLLLVVVVITVEVDLVFELLVVINFGILLRDCVCLDLSIIAVVRVCVASLLLLLLICVVVDDFDTAVAICC